MTELHEGSHEDVLRAFFRFRVVDIGRLIKKVKDAATTAARNTGRSVVDFLPEANRIVITVLRSAFDYRIYNVGVYGLEMPMINPWTSRPSVIDVVLSLFDASTKAAEAQGASGGGQSRLGEPHTQLADLAEILFACIQERLNWLSRYVKSLPTLNWCGLNRLQRCCS
jgi:nuclear pore complex protein Nup133